jgi:hypothetical protein
MPKRKPLDQQGGSSQRANRAKAVAAEHGAVDDDVPVPTRLRTVNIGYATLDSQAAWNWLQKWSWGKLSSIAVQQEAFNSYMDYQRMLYKVHLNDGWIPRSIHDLAQLGSWGDNPGNINRDLKHWLGEPTLPKPMVITVPMTTPKPKTGEAMTKDVQFPIL